MSKFSIDESLLQRARELHNSVPYCDGHNDLPWGLRDIFVTDGVSQHDINFRENQKHLKFLGPISGGLHTDIPRLRAGGVGWQFWSVFTPATEQGPLAVQWTLEQIDRVYRFMDTYRDTFQIAYWADDVQTIYKRGKIACMMGMEGGHQIHSSMGTLRMMHRLGVRYMTLTHTACTSWADSALSSSAPISDPIHNGLTPFGEAVVLEMNRIGMMVDLSHVHYVTMLAALAITRSPVIFSHSSVHAVCNHRRNVPDDVLLQLKRNNGLVMVTFVASFIAGPMHVRDGVAGASLLDVADHIDYLRNLIGVEHIGITGDFDGTNNLPRGLEDVSKYPYLTAELLRRGYTDEEIKKILYYNMLRVLRDNERISKELSAVELPSEAVERQA